MDITSSLTKYPKITDDDDDLIGKSSLGYLWVIWYWIYILMEGGNWIRNKWVGNRWELLVNFFV
jgi:hypothetical protein